MAMVITRLMGGLGNQMFQYALGLHLALKNNAPLLLDLAFFDRPAGAHTSREFGLDAFDLEYRKATPEQLTPFRSFEKGGALAAIDRKLKQATSHHFITDRLRGFQPEVLEAKGLILLHGYWQSEKYFLPIEEEIRRSFTFKHPLIGPAQEYAQQIQNSNSISIHVRRGDYVGAASDYYAMCDAAYYRAGIAHIAAHHTSPELFVFSDDIPWVQANLHFDHPTTYVEPHSAQRTEQDMQLMSLCRHNIIANSSYSWWGAWLNSNPSKMVVAPRQWFKAADMDASDIIPEQWARL